MGGRRTLIVLAGVVLAAAAVAPVVLPWLTNPPDQRMVDLDVYRSGGQAVLRGAPVYDFLTQPPQLLPFTYPPFAVLLALPLAMVSWSVAQWAWVILIFVALTVVVRYSFAELLARFRGWAPLLAGALVALCTYPLPLRDQIRFGQVDVFLVAMCLADCTGRPKRWPRGALVGLATAIKLVPGVFIIYFWVTGRRREAVNATVAAAVATLGTFLVLPGDSADYWFRALFDSERLGSNTGTANQAIRGILMRMHWPDAVTSLVWLACVALVVFFGFREARRAYLDGNELAGVAITGLIAVLVSPVAWIHHLAWLVAVFGALVGAGRDRRSMLVAGLVWLFYVLELPWWGMRLLAHGQPLPGRLLQAAYGVGALVLVLCLRRWLPRESDEANTWRNREPVGTLKG